MSAGNELDNGPDGVQCAVAGVLIAGAGASETIVQRQVVRVGAAFANVNNREIRSDADVLTSILAGVVRTRSVLKHFALLCNIQRD